MELKKIRERWNSFPEMSMEERPVLSTDLEKLIVKNPLTGGFYLKNKLVIKIIAGIILIFYNIYRLKVQLVTNGDDLYQQACLFCVLSYFVFFHVRLLLFADYSSLLSLPLLPFLGKIETVLDKYIQSFRIISIMAGFYLLEGIEAILARVNPYAYASVSQNPFYKWLIIIFLAVSFYILLLHSIIQKYRKLLAVVKAYREMIGAKSQKL